MDGKKVKKYSTTVSGQKVFFARERTTKPNPLLKHLKSNNEYPKPYKK
jgi:hypothetical protein